MPNAKEALPTSQADAFHFPPPWQGVEWGPHGRCFRDDLIEALTVIGGLAYAAVVAMVIGTVLSIILRIATGG